MTGLVFFWIVIGILLSVAVPVAIRTRTFLRGHTSADGRISLGLDCTKIQVESRESLRRPVKFAVHNLLVVRRV
jgi:hypothetical protein